MVATPVSFNAFRALTSAASNGSTSLVIFVGFLIIPILAKSFPIIVSGFVSSVL